MKKTYRRHSEEFINLGDTLREIFGELQVGDDDSMT